MGHALMTQGSLSKFVESTIGGSRSMTEDVTYTTEFGDDGKRVRVAQETDHRKSKGIRTKEDVTNLLQYMDIIGTGFHGQRFSTAMAGTQRMLGKVQCRTGGDPQVLQDCVNEL